MAKSSQIISLVKAGTLGDKIQFKRVVESLIAEERAKKHFVLADQLEHEIKKLSTSNSPIQKTLMNASNKISSLIEERSPKVKLSDLVLPPFLIDSLEELIEEQSRVDLLRSYSLEPRNKVLLIGPPGNGKTSLAEAMAESMMIPLLIVRYEGVIGSYLGETASRLKQVIDYASTRHCVLLFDEFETLGKERGDTHDTGEIKRVVSSLLMQIDSIPSHVIVMAATNHSELLDKAVWRRFQLRLEVPLPTRGQIEEWFINFENKHSIELSYAYETLAKKLHGSNFSEIEEFGKSILRKHVLNQTNKNLRGITSQLLKTWSKRTFKAS